MNTYLFGFIVAATASLFLTRVVRDLAIRLGWFDIPDAIRKLHGRPIPAVGGLALVVSMAFAAFACALVPTRVGEMFRADARNVLLLAVLASAMMTVGIWDDVRGLSSKKKLAVQILLASIAWTVGFRIDGWGLYDGSYVQLGVFALPITLLWIVGLTNAFNMIDGVDGLAAGAALFATMALLVAAVAAGQSTTALLLATLAGATAGFLRYNFNPASIFLGDSGSLLLGFTLALLSIQSSQKSTAAFAVAVPMVSLALPVLDTVVVVIRRLIRRRPVLGADRRHIHHMLLDRGRSPRQVVIGLYAVCGMLGLLSLLFLSPAATRATGKVLIMLGIAVGIGIQQLRIPELRALNAHLVQGLRGQRRLLAGGAIVQTMLDGFRRARTPADVIAALTEGLSEAELMSATLELPSGFAPAGVDGGWVKGSRGNGVVLRWRGANSSSQPEVELNTPIPLGDQVGRMILSAPACDVTHAALMSWTVNGVAAAIGEHLMRTVPLTNAECPGAERAAAVARATV